MFDTTIQTQNKLQTFDQTFRNTPILSDDNSKDNILGDKIVMEPGYQVRKGLQTQHVSHRVTTFIIRTL